MKQPGGFEIGDHNQVYSLKKVVIWLKQSPRQWYKWFDEFMIKLGYAKSHYDSCVYFKAQEQN